MQIKWYCKYLVVMLVLVLVYLNVAPFKSASEAPWEPSPTVAEVEPTLTQDGDALQPANISTDPMWTVGAPLTEFFMASTHPSRLLFPTNESMVPIHFRNLPPRPSKMYNNLYYFTDRLIKGSDENVFVPCEESLSDISDPSYRYIRGPLDIVERAGSLSYAVMRRSLHTHHWNRTWPEVIAANFSERSPDMWKMRRPTSAICRTMEGWHMNPVVDGVVFPTYVNNDEPVADQMRLLSDVLLPSIRSTNNNAPNTSSVFGAVATYFCLTALTSPFISLLPGGRAQGGGGIFIDPTRGLLWGPPMDSQMGTPRRGVQHVPVCLVTSARLETLVVSSDLFMDGATWSTQHSTPTPSPSPLAYFGYIERPQHTLQFLFSLIGHLTSIYDLCAQRLQQGEQGIAPRDIHVHFSVITYGNFQRHSDITDFRRYPHMELMALAPFLIERMQGEMTGDKFEAGSPREQWRRALFAQLHFVHDKQTFNAVTTVPPPASTQDATSLWGRQYLRRGTSPHPATHLASVGPPLKVEGYLYSTVLVGGPGLRILAPKKYRENDARAATGHHSSIPFPGPFYLFMIRRLLVDYYGLTIRQTPADFHAPNEPEVRQFRLLVVARTLAKRRLILNEGAGIGAVVKGLFGDTDPIHDEVSKAYADFKLPMGRISRLVSSGVWRLFSSSRLVITIVDWEGLQHPKGKPKKAHKEADIRKSRLPDTLPKMLNLAMNTDVMMGVHGNGLCWACFMSSLRGLDGEMNPFSGRNDTYELPLNGSTKYPLLIEITSDIQHRNEVSTGVNVKNVGNMPGNVCPITSISIAGAAVDNAYSRQAPTGHQWKEVDVRLGGDTLKKIVSFVRSHKPE